MHIYVRVQPCMYIIHTNGKQSQSEIQELVPKPLGGDEHVSLKEKNTRRLLQEEQFRAELLCNMFWGRLRCFCYRM